MGAWYRLAVSLSALWVCALASPADAGDAPIRADFAVFAGTDVARDSTFAWAGMAGALPGGLGQDGWRFQLMGGFGRYRYRTGAVPGGVNSGRVTSGELMIGHQKKIASTIVTLYAGVHAEDQRVSLPDPGNRAVGTAFGIKGTVDVFARPARSWNWSGSASVSTVHRAYHARAAVLREFPPAVAVGVEAALHGDVRYIEPRAGLIAQLSRRGSVLALAAGVLSNSDKGNGLYATVSLHARH